MREAKLVANHGSSNPSKFNYEKLQPLVIENIFDSLGNWLVHRNCASRFFGIILYCFTIAYFKALDIAGAPNEICWRSENDPRNQAFLSRIILPEECLIGVPSYLASL